MMEKYEIQKLRELPIEKVAKEMGMKVEHHKALCPFHDDHHASLTFNKTKNSCISSGLRSVAEGMAIAL
jgi:DNA primase